MIRTDRCFDVPYKGATLHAGQRAWWSVQVWDERDEASAPSEPTWFEMGLLDPDNWQAQWLAIEGAEEIADRAAGLDWIWGNEGLSPRLQKFRFRCSLPGTPTRTELFLAAKDNLKGVWVNGRSLPLPSESHFWGTMTRSPVELAAGAMVFCAAATAATAGFFPPDGGAVVALLKVTGADGKVTRLTTGPDWLTSSADYADWTRPDFDDRSLVQGGDLQGENTVRGPGYRNPLCGFAVTSMSQSRLSARGCMRRRSRLTKRASMAGK